MSPRLLGAFEKCYPKSDPIRFEIDLPIDRFGITMLLGPSGCGKTTVLRCLAGLLRPESGTITVGDKTWFDQSQGICLTPQERDIGFLFQDFALFPHLNAEENIGFGLSRNLGPKRQERIQELMRQLEITGLEKHLPYQLSGGEQQRVALARAVARKPKLLLLDEPLSALDQITRSRVRPELKEILSAFQIPVILVTHDRQDALALGDHLIVMKEGNILEQGSVQDVFAHPASRDCAKLLGMENILPGEWVSPDPCTILVNSTRLIAAPPRAFSHGGPPNQKIKVGIWAEDVQVGPQPAPSQTGNSLTAIVKTILQEGPMTRIGLDCGFPLTARVNLSPDQKANLKHGQTIPVSVDPRSIQIMKD